MPTAEILSQGDEVITGQVIDTNAAWLSTRLAELGFTVRRHTVVGDRLPDLRRTLREIAGRCDVCVGTGGLGPTADDLTADAVSEAFGVALAFDAQAMEAIAARFARSGRPMPATNERQAWLPAGGVRLDNDWGTAPGFAFEASGTRFAFLPGVPREMRAMFDARVLPLLRPLLPAEPPRRITLRTVGIGESALQERVGAFHHPTITLSYRTSLPENHLVLRAPGTTPEAELVAVAADLARRVGHPLFTVEGLPPHATLEGVDTEGGDLAEVVGRALVARGATLALAESCTGGLLGATITRIPGASAWFLEGAVTYSNDAKVRALGVDPATLERHGAVSEPVARAMAEGMRRRSGATYALSVTGIAGPGGGSAEKPVGTVHIALATPEGTLHRAVHLPGDRERTRTLAAATALDLLRRHLTLEA